MAFRIWPNPSHIVPVMVGDASKCKFISDVLMDEPRHLRAADQLPDRAGQGTERLRITPTPMHSDADIKHLAGALSELWSQCALARAVA
jgi:5-aminolevulinate synthase